MKPVKLTLAAIALTLGLLKPVNAYPEHLMEKLRSFQTESEINPAYSKDNSSYLFIDEKLPPRIIKDYRVGDMDVRVYYFPEIMLQFPDGLLLKFPQYPRNYLIKYGTSVEEYVDPETDGLNGNEVFKGDAQVRFQPEVKYQ